MSEFQIRRLLEHDLYMFHKLVMLFHEVFEMTESVELNKPYLGQILAKNDFIVFAVILENEVLGGLTAYELSSYYSEHSEAFIYDIAIKKAYQRKGLGKKLLLALKKYCSENNIKVIFVEANEEDAHAVDFYHSTGGQAEKVIHFNYLLGNET